MSSACQVHASGAEQLSTPEKVVATETAEENVSTGEEQRAPKRKTVSEPEESDRDLKKRKSSPERPASMAKDQATDERGGKLMEASPSKQIPSSMLIRLSYFRGSLPRLWRSGKQPTKMAKLTR